MKPIEMRAKTTPELDKELLDLRRARFSMRMQAATQQLTNHSQIGKVRKDIARVKTILGERSAAK